MEKNNKSIAIWLLCGAFLVLVMVAVGGITRLTHSGLSMVTWKPVTGIIPPLNSAQWNEEFSAYKTTPEYIQRNYNFSLTKFKSIYWWEYTHRLIARLIGLAFLLPFLYFLLTKKLQNKTLQKQLIVLFLLGLLQGVVGWLMVKSGLINKPEVSHYRLATHLVMAFILIAYLLWLVLKLMYPAKAFTTDKKIKRLIHSLFFLSILQIVYGAFLAGLKAGYYYGTFPKMGEEWMPALVIDVYKEKGLLSLIDFGISVQFIHRWLAAVVLFCVVSLWYVVQKNERASPILKKCSFALLCAIGVQCVLGALTLLTHVQITLAVFHQVMAVIFFGILILTKYHSSYTQLSPSKNLF